jgi:hypothetical protein
MRSGGMATRPASGGAETAGKELWTAACVRPLRLLALAIL